jgi:hypothetical protein
LAKKGQFMLYKEKWEKLTEFHSCFSMRFSTLKYTLDGSLMELVSFFRGRAPLGSKRAQWCPLVAVGCGTLLEMPSRSANFMENYGSDAFYRVLPRISCVVDGGAKPPTCAPERRV